MEEQPKLSGDDISNVLRELGLYDDNYRLIRYYLSIAGAYWREGEFERLKKLALGLRDNDEFIRRMIRARNWRPTMIGFAVAVLLGKRDLQADMIWRLENNSWASPQLAAGIAILDEGKGEERLLRIVETASEDSDPKTIISAVCSLKFINSTKVEKFEESRIIKTHLERDFDSSKFIAGRQWNYWKNVEPLVNE